MGTRLRNSVGGRYIYMHTVIYVMSEIFTCGDLSGKYRSGKGKRVGTATYNILQYTHQIQHKYTCVQHTLSRNSGATLPCRSLGGSLHPATNTGRNPLVEQSA